MNLPQSIALNLTAVTVPLMGSMGGRLQEALDRRGRTAPDVIRACKTSKGTVYNILNDVTRPEKVWADTVTRICTYLGISRDWLLWGKGSMDDEALDTGDGDWTEVRAAEQSVALGDGAAPEEYAETHKLKFRASSLRRKGLRPDRLEVYYGDGDSMEPRIRKGDAILFDTSDTRIVDDRIYVISHEGHIYAKRLQHLGDRIAIVSDNRDDPKWRKPVLVGTGDNFQVLGRVRWIGSWED
jgi:transcriptional regulator with XRE-family HTH domain